MYIKSFLFFHFFSSKSLVCAFKSIFIFFCVEKIFHFISICQIYQIDTINVLFQSNRIWFDCRIIIRSDNNTERVFKSSSILKKKINSEYPIKISREKKDGILEHVIFRVTIYDQCRVFCFQINVEIAIYLLI